MVPDWQTDTVYFSDLLPKRYPAVAREIFKILKDQDVPYYLIPSTKDIWARDYMPIQLDENRYLQFLYQPDYLAGCPQLTTKFQSTARPVTMVVDGGNVVSSARQVIMTDKVCQENSSWSKTMVRNYLTHYLQAEVLFIPKQPYDKVAHSDGVVRFVDDCTVVMNDFTGVEEGYRGQVYNSLKSRRLDVHFLPYEFVPKSKSVGQVESAVGIYTNYLRVGNVVIVPAFGLEKDEEAKEKLQKLLPRATIFQVDATKLAEAGGVFNCISWSTKERTCQGKTRPLVTARIAPRG